MKTASVSGSCSAWATRSEAMKRAIAAFAHNHNFRGASEKIYAAIKGDELFRGGHKQVSRPDDLVDL